MKWLAAICIVWITTASFTWLPVLIADYRRRRRYDKFYKRLRDLDLDFAQMVALNAARRKFERMNKYGNNHQVN